MELPPADIEVGLQRYYARSSERMPELPDGSVDVAVTSPPYNRGKRYHPSYSDRQPEAAYRALLVAVFAEVRRVLSPEGVLFLNVGDGAEDQGKSERVCGWAEEAGLHRVQTLVWVKSLLGRGHFTPSGRGRRFSNVFEYIFVLGRARRPALDVKAVGIPYADKSNIGRYSDIDLRDAGNVWFIPYAETTGASVKKGHEAPFPVELPWRAIRCVAGARRVLDPFAGTAATLAAAASLGIPGVGYDPYPVLDVVERRLRTPFRPPPTLLLPEMERALRTLARLFPAARDPAFVPPRRRLRRELEEARRLLDLLEGPTPGSFPGGTDPPPRPGFPAPPISSRPARASRERPGEGLGRSG